MKRKKLSLLLLACFILFAGCGKKGENVPMGVNPPVGTVNLSMRTPVSLNPAENPWESCKNTFLLIYDGLFCVNDKLEATPVLVDSYSVLSEGMEVMLYLRTDVFWHDGTPFTAKDVIHTFETIRNTENSAYESNLKSVISWNKIDDYAVSIFLSEPSATVVHDLTFPILPAHHSDYGKTAVGTGPFKVASYEPQKTITLVPNETYFRGTPKISKVNISFVRTDDMAVAAFYSRATDVIPASIQESVSFSQEKAMNYISFPSTRMVFLGMNTKNPCFASARTRLALNSLVDRATMASEDYQGKAVPANSTIHPQADGYNPEISSGEYSLDLARENLFAAGWSDWDGDGIIEISETGTQEGSMGERTAFECTVLTNEEDVRRILVANRLVKAMSEVGISASLEIVPYEVYFERISTGNYDCYLGKVEMESIFDVGFLVGSGGESNFTGYVSERLDGTITAMMKAEDSISTKVSADEYQRIFAEEWPIVPICFLDSGWYVWDRLDFHATGYQNPYCCSHLWEITTPQE